MHRDSCALDDSSKRGDVQSCAGLQVVHESCETGQGSYAADRADPPFPLVEALVDTDDADLFGTLNGPLPGPSSGALAGCSGWETRRAT